MSNVYSLGLMTVSLIVAGILLPNNALAGHGKWSNGTQLYFTIGFPGGYFYQPPQRVHRVYHVADRHGHYVVSTPVHHRKYKKHYPYHRQHMIKGARSSHHRGHWYRGRHHVKKYCR